MYVYDQAHTLAKAIRESDQYKLLMSRKSKIDNDQELKKMFTDYRAKQFAIQRAQVLGQQVPEDLMQAFRKMNDIVAANTILKDFLEAESRLGTMMNDIQKIIVDGLNLG